MKYRVYTLSDPYTMEVRYVGQTCQKLKLRNNGHMSCRNRFPDRPKDKWLIELANAGKYPVIEELECIDAPKEEARELESYWIHQMLAWGLKLLNSNKRGEPGFQGKTTGKKVYQYTLDGEFIREYASAAEADRAMGSPYAHVNQVCMANNAVKVFANSQWSYNKVVNMGGITHRRPLPKPISKYSMRGDLIASYKSLTEGAKASGLNFKAVSLCALGITNSSGGFKWKYHEI